MDLQEFIKTTLVDIKNGLREANKEFAKQEGKTLGTNYESQFVMRPNGQDNGHIAFDIAVTVTQEDNKIGGGGIKVAVANLGGEISKSTSQENITRIKFHVTPHVFIG